MNKFSALLLIIFLAPISSIYANNHDRLLSLGYAHIKVKDLPTLNGINVKAQMRSPANKDFSLQITGTLAQKSSHNNENARYVSLAMGPTYALTPYLEWYGTLGASGISYKTQNNENKDNASKSLSWGTGFTFTTTKNIALTLGYEGSYFKMAGKSYPSYALIGNIGYWF